MLVATSGDTGSAVAHAFFGVAGTRVVVLYPEGQVSAVQEAQFTTLGGNVTAVAVARHVRRLPAAGEGGVCRSRRCTPRVRLTSANSISLGRLLPQMFYYAYAALQAGRDKPLTISVPSGNFGNLAAGVMAWKMGAPIACVRRADDDQRHGAALSRDRPRRAAAVGADAGQRDGRRQSEQPRAAALAVRRRSRRRCSGDHVERHTDDEVRTAIASCIERYGYVADPHTAIGYLGVPQKRTGLSLFLATAHPAKFREVVRAGDRARPCRYLMRWPRRWHARRSSQRIGPTLGELSKLL